MYNEASIIEASLNEFYSCMKENFDDFELIFVDDGSKDGCGNAVSEYAKDHEGVILAGYGINQGKGCAVRTGVLKSTGDIVIYTDCDIAYGTGAVVEFANYLKNHPSVSVLLGSRNLGKDGYEGYTAIRKLASKTYILVLNIIAGFSLSDSQCGIKGFRGDDARKIFNLCESNRFAFDIEVILTAQKLKLKIDEYPVKIINHRESKVNVIKDTFRMVRDVIRIKKRVKKKFRKQK